MKRLGRYYVYAIFRPNGQPCYIGKGKRGRFKHHAQLGRNHKNRNLARMYARYVDLPVVKIREYLLEEEALELEVLLIGILKRTVDGGILLNKNCGGGGFGTGSKSGEHKSKISEALKRYHASMSNKQKQVRSNRISATTRKAMGPEVRAKISTALSGKKHSIERRVENSIRLKKVYRENKAFRENLRRVSLNSRKMLGKKHSADTKRRMSISQTLRFQRERANGSN